MSRAFVSVLVGVSAAAAVAQATDNPQGLCPTGVDGDWRYTAYWFDRDARRDYAGAKRMLGRTAQVGPGRAQFGDKVCYVLRVETERLDRYEFDAIGMKPAYPFVLVLTCLGADPQVMYMGRSCSSAVWVHNWTYFELRRVRAK